MKMQVSASSLERKKENLQEPVQPGQPHGVSVIDYKP